MMFAPRTIAVIGDIHYGQSPGPDRHGDIGDILLQRAIAHLNDFVQPDATLLVGDILANGDAPDADERRRRIRRILGDLSGPYVIIPGNHDGSADAFYRIFEGPNDFVDVAGMRVVPFIDRDCPGFQAERKAADIGRLARARATFAGPILALQHVPVLPQESEGCPYNHRDSDAIIERMKAANIQLSISGHYHQGYCPVQVGPTTLITAPSLHRSPFEILIIRLDGDGVNIEPQALAVDAALHLRDYHIHTEFGYCAQDVSMARGIDLGHRFGMAEVGFAEHSGQLYYSEPDYWEGCAHRLGVAGVDAAANRMPPYFRHAAAVRQVGVRVGLEVDFDFEGHAVLRAEDRARADYLLGAIHRLAILESGRCSVDEVVDAFGWMVDRICEQDVDVLAHPFRIIKRDGIEIDRSIMEHVVSALRRSDTAAEINFHMGGPPLAFVTMCMDSGVKLALGGDAHHLFDIGNFVPHIDLLKAAGAPRNLHEVLFRLPD